MSIAFIAPYESLHLMALDVIAAGNYPAKSYMGDMAEGVAAARVALADGVKVIISRGGTARMIREELGVDPVEVLVSGHNILDYVHEHTNIGTRIAIVGYRQFINAIEPVCRILKRQRATFEIGADEPSEKVLDKAAAWRPDIILGDAVSVRLAMKRGLPCHLVESDAASLTKAFERAMLMLSNINRHLASAEKLSAVLDCTQEGTMLVNNAGVIEEINRRGCMLLGVERGEILGADVRAVFDSEPVLEAVAEGKNAGSVIVPRGDKPLAVTVMPFIPEQEASGTVILFQQVEEIQEAESNIRKQLLDKGFFAKYTFRDILCKSAVMRRLVSVAKEYSKTSSNIMIQGETGTGKELFAQSIHNAGPLAKGPFVAVNCAALPGTLMESELFGYAPGAFTGALRHGKTGLFELAHGGTLFLDEISEMDVLLQARLLRAIQAKEIMRLGDNRVTPVSVRIIAATNRNPAEEVAAGRMRADLFFRLNVLDLVVPPLREREGDAAFLFAHYLGVYETAMRRRVRKPSAAFFRELENRLWPGNVRELENLAEKYVTLDGALSAEDIRRGLPLVGASANTAPSASLDGSLQEITARIVRGVLAEEGGNVSRTASRLGVDRNTIRRWLEKGAD
ncbi:sigma 54-interacting transcriptional regulator [Desulfovibrio sp. OttesenSCG-928-O18]|nr:sigma 54-interacting transcriptional regulator [Desulfovibrio sp. OttesenSCG-928-O18]